MFRQFLLNAQNIFGTVHTQMGFVRLQYMNFKAVLQCSQLFE